jgi:hypothetical protein
MKYLNRYLLVMGFIVLCTVAIDIAWQFHLEKSARITARFNLKQAQVCVNDLLLKSHDAAIYSPNITNDDIEKALKTCAREMRVTTTGDMFAFNLRTTEFVFDPSLDCFVEGGKYMTKESECQLHNDPKKCEEIMAKMYNGYDSSIDDLNWWKFDNAREYLEWVILPSEKMGFDGLIRGGILKPNQILLAQGVQEDELHARYRGFTIMLYGIMFFSIIVNLLFAKYEAILKSNEHERR